MIGNVGIVSKKLVESLEAFVSCPVIHIYILLYHPVVVLSNLDLTNADSISAKHSFTYVRSIFDSRLVNGRTSKQ